MEPTASDTERERLLALQAMKILDTPAEESFDRLTRIAAAIFDVPIALVSLVDEDRQWFKSRVGLDVSETDRRISFCAHSLGGTRPLVVPDALEDERFQNNPSVTGTPNIRFYAGAQLRMADDLHLGTFCIIDTQPRPEPSAQQLALLEDLAATTTLLIEQRRMVLEYEAHVQARRETEERLRAAKEEAEVSTRAMRALFSRVSHDLRTPLSAIMGFAELLADSPLNAEQKEDVAEVQRGARNLLAMIDSLLGVARITEERAGGGRRPRSLDESEG